MKTIKTISPIFITFLLFTCNFLLVACDSADPKPGEAVLSIEDASCTEAWLKLTSGGVSLPYNASLMQDGKERKTLSITTADTILYVDSLQPNITYDFQITSNQNPASSNQQQVTTMDTTSHNFTWEVYTFGEHENSRLTDVAIIDENNIWASGEIYLNDSTGQNESAPSNIIIWNNDSFDFRKVMIKDFGILSGYYITKTIFAFSIDNVWLASYADFIHWDGNSFQSKAFFGETIPFYGQVNKMWGQNSDNVYCVGNSGAVYYYFGTSWQRIVCNTDLNIVDIWGIETNGKQKVFCLASELFSGINSELYEIKDNTTVLVTNDLLGTESLSLWFNEYKMYIVGGKTFVNTKGVSGWKDISNEVARPVLYSIRGTDLNDIVTSGAYLEIVHFNGISWKRYDISVNGDKYGIFQSIAIKGNTICAVGFLGRQAIIAIGKR